MTTSWAVRPASPPATSRRIVSSHVAVHGRAAIAGWAASHSSARAHCRRPGLGARTAAGAERDEALRGGPEGHPRVRRDDRLELGEVHPGGRPDGGDAEQAGQGATACLIQPADVDRGQCVPGRRLQSLVDGGPHGAQRGVAEIGPRGHGRGLVNLDVVGAGRLDLWLLGGVFLDDDLVGVVLLGGVFLDDDLVGVVLLGDAFLDDDLGGVFLGEDSGGVFLGEGPGGFLGVVLLVGVARRAAGRPAVVCSSCCWSVSAGSGLPAGSNRLTSGAASTGRSKETNGRSAGAIHCAVSSVAVCRLRQGGGAASSTAGSGSAGPAGSPASAGFSVRNSCSKGATAGQSSAGMARRAWANRGVSNSRRSAAGSNGCGSAQSSRATGGSKNGPDRAGGARRASGGTTAGNGSGSSSAPDSSASGAENGRSVGSASGSAGWPPEVTGAGGTAAPGT